MVVVPSTHDGGATVAPLQAGGGTGIKMLSCQEITELVTEYVEGAMSTDDRLRFETHISLCRHCRAYLNQMRDTAAMLKRLTEEPVPEPVLDELRDKFREWKK